MLGLLSRTGLDRVPRAPMEVETNDPTRCLARCLANALDPTSVASEAYRDLRTDLLCPSAANPPKVVLRVRVTAKGRRSARASLCVAPARLAKRTSVIDCHL